jgi:hypothetical protein
MGFRVTLSMEAQTLNALPALAVKGLCGWA